MNFTHLHVHNEYSFLDGLGSAKSYAAKAKEIGFESLAITNHGNVDGCIKFQFACQEENIKPIIGCELYVVKDLSVKEKEEKRKHLCVYAYNEKGWTNLLKMLTIANLDGLYYRPRIDPKTIMDNSEGLVFSSACTASLITTDWGIDLFIKLKEYYPENVFLEIMPHIMKDQYVLNEFVIDFSKKFNIKIIATNDCHYINEGDEVTQEVLLAMQSKKKWKDKDRWKFSIDGLYLKSQREMVAAFRKQNKLSNKIYLEALENTQIVFDICKEFLIPKRDVVLPNVPGIPDGKTDEEFIRELCIKGMEEKPIGRKRIYLSRIEEELQIIIKQGFSRYFLLVWELINWCRENDIMVGPGRGSSGGSLVAYLLGITAVDPIKYGLLFARFISPARIDLPDIDMDFEDIKRNKILQHLKETYGVENVSGASNFSTLKGRQSLHDVARVFDVPLAEVGKAAKSIVVRNDGDLRSDFTIKDAFTTFEDGKEFAKKYPHVVDHAIKLEGQKKGVGQHAAAMIISKNSLKEGENACLRYGKNNELLVNWEKEDLEYAGLMKLDVLGLSALTILNEAKNLVKINKNLDIDYNKIPLDDKKVFEEFSKGNNIGVFQFGSLGLRKVCQELGIEDFNMLVHANALYRPGTLRSGMVQQFQLRKRNEIKWDYLHPFLKEITGETYGIILYQEQIMKFMYDLGGLSWKTTDTVRKIIGKSKGADQFLKFKQIFSDGCVKRKTLNKETAEKLWDELASFGSYGFNKSHSVEYSLISYWDMYMKIYHPVEFICACLTYGQEDKKEEIIQEARNFNIEIRPPKFKISNPTKWIIKNNILYAPLIEIKGFGEKLSNNIFNMEFKNGFFKYGGRNISIRVKEILEDINFFNDLSIEEEFLSKYDKYFNFSFSKDISIKYRKIINKIKEAIEIRNIKEIDFKTTEKDTHYYFGKMTEIKYGYKNKFNNFEKKLVTSNITNNLGGVYGNFQDDTDFVMLIFDNKFYLNKKYQIEHCEGEHLLIKANHPMKTSLIQGLDGWFGEELLKCELNGLNKKLIFNRRFRKKDNEYLLSECNSCDLRTECKAPVYPSFGLKNIALIGEAPGREEDKIGKAFVGDFGDIVWNFFKKFNIEREIFHITNVNKCWPSKSKTPNNHQIKSCRKWLDYELKNIKPIIALAFGNTNLKFFNSEESGIMDKCGQTEWNEEYGMWICWCIHPASSLYNPSNKELFEKGMKNFVNKLNILGLNK
jgi:DNA polymerase-3 subunit alpha